MNLVAMVAVGFVVAAAVGVIASVCASWAETHLVKRPELPELICAQCRRSMREAARAADAELAELRKHG
jgi:hypothetical protein